jgi:hypothetical protein
MRECSRMTPERRPCELVDHDETVSADLDVIEARWRIGLITASDLHALASDLLDSGVSSDSLIDLFALPVDVAVWDGPALFDAALTELGRGRMTDTEAAHVVARHIARSVLSGALEPSQATALASSIYIRSGYRFDDFHELYVLDDEMNYLDKNGRGYLGRTDAVVADAVRAEAQRILGVAAGRG